MEYCCYCVANSWDPAVGITLGFIVSSPAQRSRDDDQLLSQICKSYGASGYLMASPPSAIWGMSGSVWASTRLLSLCSATRFVPNMETRLHVYEVRRLALPNGRDGSLLKPEHPLVN